MSERIGKEELRQLIREVLREALAQPSPPCGERVAGPKGRLGEGSRAVERGGGPSPSPSPQGGGGGAYSFTSGVLTEAKVVEIGRAHSRILIAGEVAVTPLARDKARQLKLKIERQKP